MPDHEIWELLESQVAVIRTAEEVVAHRVQTAFKELCTIKGIDGATVSARIIGQNGKTVFEVTRNA